MKNKTYKKLKLTLGIILGVGLMLAATLQNCEARSPERPADCAHRWVVLTSPDGQMSFRIKAEQATTPETKEKGLMFRESMPFDHGMIFYWDKPQPIYMWMKNTLIPLDMVFALGGKVTGVVQATETESERVLTVPGNADTVLEVNLGVAAAKGVGAGWSIKPAGCATADKTKL